MEEGYLAMSLPLSYLTPDMCVMNFILWQHVAIKIILDSLDTRLGGFQK